MEKDPINYGVLIDEAMHVIVKKALDIARDKEKLGDHHFFISFLTEYPGVIISEKLRNKYPHEMTVVLQYQYEDLHVNDNEFSVILSFENIKERITVPFSSLTAFADPSVKFGLQFRHYDIEEEIISEKRKHEEYNPASKKSKIEGNYSKSNNSSGSNIIKLDSFRKNKKNNPK